jgi:proteasome lid subunit RPN8/RPN11
VALKKVMEHAKSTADVEVIGFLIGRMEEEARALIIDDIADGLAKSGVAKAVMPAETIAKIADDIIKKRIRGNIVGWYHSHPKFGLFLSDVDIRTQAKLEQFSQYVVALVVDPTSDEVGFFTLDAQTGGPIAVPEEHVHIFKPGENPVPEEFKTHLLEIPTETHVGLPPHIRVEYAKPEKETKRQPKPGPSRQMFILGIIAFLCIGLVAGYLVAIGIRPPQITVSISPESAIAYVYDPLVFNASVSRGGPNYNFTWYLNGNQVYNVPNVTHSTFSVAFNSSSPSPNTLYVNITDIKTGATAVSKKSIIQVRPLYTYVEIESPKNGTQFPWGAPVWINGTLQGIHKGYPIALSNETIGLNFTSSIGGSVLNKTTTDEEGIFDFALPNGLTNSPAEISSTVMFLGNGTYDEASSEITLKIVRRDTNISIDTTEPGLISGELNDTYTGDGYSNATVICEVARSTEWETVNETTTNGTGAYSMQWNSTYPPENYTIRTLFQGNNLYSQSHSANETVTPDSRLTSFVNTTNTQVTVGVYVNFTVRINNMGFFSDNATITLEYQYHNETTGKYEPAEIIRVTTIGLEPGIERDVTFAWSTAGAAKGQYLVTSYVESNITGNKGPSMDLYVSLT